MLQPKLVGHSVGLHPVWLMFALFAFGSIFGFVGTLIAVPTSAAIAVLVRFALSRYLESELYEGTRPSCPRSTTWTRRRPGRAKTRRPDFPEEDSVARKPHQIPLRFAHRAGDVARRPDHQRSGERRRRSDRSLAGLAVSRRHPRRADGGRQVASGSRLAREVACARTVARNPRRSGGRRGSVRRAGPRRGRRTLRLFRADAVPPHQYRPPARHELSHDDAHVAVGVGGRASRPQVAAEVGHRRGDRRAGRRDAGAGDRQAVRRPPDRRRRTHRQLPRHAHGALARRGAAGRGADGRAGAGARRPDKPRACRRSAGGVREGDESETSRHSFFAELV